MLGVLGLFAMTLLGVAVAPGVKVRSDDMDDDGGEGDDRHRSEIVEGRGFLNLDGDDAPETSGDDADPDDQGGGLWPDIPETPDTGGADGDPDDDPFVDLGDDLDDDPGPADPRIWTRWGGTAC